MGIWKMNTNVFLILCKSYVEKREAVNSLQEELANVQDHLNLTKQVSLTNVIFWWYPEGMQTIGWNNKSSRGGVGEKGRHSC